MEIQFSSEKLITQRKLQGFSQEKLAEKAGINIRTLQRLEKNEVTPQLYTLRSLADSLGVKIEDLTVSAPTGITTEKSTRQMALLHFSATTGCVFPLGNLIAPLLLWIYKKQADDAWDKQAREILNFQMSWLLYLFLVLVLYFTIPVLPFLVFLIPVIVFLNILLFPIYSGFRVINNQPPFYPLTIPFLKPKT
ncbi:MAG: hypothetical protein B7Z54_02960 [Sphingobacteriales bacterium 12-47-4]|nr:MAG: hypothetical protein B7Z54_02960 [Sphingobacteriales bacterium 12-47-4]